VNDLTGPMTREAMMLLATTAGPLIGVLLVIGLVIGVFQAATQINDPAVGFLPRLAAALGAVWLLGGWLLERYSTFFATSVERMSRH
jgi:flagellar biosynthesis protein FliQ